MILKRLRSIPLGYSQVLYQKRKYGVSRQEYNNGKSIKLYAEELGGKDFVSLNYYITDTVGILKPCEMAKKKVIDFLNNYRYD